MFRKCNKLFSVTQRKKEQQFIYLGWNVSFKFIRERISNPPNIPKYTTIAERKLKQLKLFTKLLRWIVKKTVGIITDPISIVTIRKLEAKGEDTTDLMNKILEIQKDINA